VLDLRAVELAGTDGDDGSKKMLAAVSDQAAKLMGDGIKTLGATVDRIGKTANETYTSTPSNNAYGRGDTVVSKRGLSSTDKKTLADVIATCKDVELSSDQLVQALGADAGAIGEVKQSTTALSAHANEVLNANYGDTTANTGTTTAQPGANSSGAAQQRPPHKESVIFARSSPARG